MLSFAGKIKCRFLIEKEGALFLPLKSRGICVGAKDQRIDDVGFSDQAYFSSKPGLYVHIVLFRIWSWSLVAAKIRRWPAIGAVLNTNLAVQLLPDN